MITRLLRVLLAGVVLVAAVLCLGVGFPVAVAVHRVLVADGVSDESAAGSAVAAGVVANALAAWVFARIVGGRS